MNIIDIINSQDSWGRNQVKELPVYGERIYNIMIRLNKTNQSRSEVFYILFDIVSIDIGYVGHNEFIDYMKIQKTMVNKEKAQELLREFWNNTSEYLKIDPKLHNIVKQTIISLNNILTSNNSTRQLRVQFIEFFLTYAIASEIEDN